MVAINEILSPECTGEECGGDDDTSTDSRVHQRNAENRAPVTRNHRGAPILVRWMEQDPAQYINGANTYQFVTSDPLGRMDSTGDFAISLTAGYSKTFVLAFGPTPILDVGWEVLASVSVRAISCCG